MPECDILVVGAGCFGLSTALHLRRRNMGKVILLERQPFPCSDAASQDSSRIIRADYPDPFHARMGLEAIERWRHDSTFSPAYHESGYLFADMPGETFVRNSFQTQKRLGHQNVQMTNFSIAKNRWPGLSGNLDNGCDLYYNPKAGWANARQAMLSALDEFQSRGGQFISGPPGTLETLLVKDTESVQSHKVVGVQTVDGTSYHAPKVVLATGAHVVKHIKAASQVASIGWCVAHWRLTPDELAIWANHPVVNLHNYGYFFPPDSTGLMKMGWGMVSYTNAAGPWRSSGIPEEAERGIRRILRMVAPSLEHKQFFDMKICWDGMMGDRHFLISRVPSYDGVYVTCGGSGHGFKFLPTIGGYAADLIENQLDSEYENRWAWREQHIEALTAAMKGRAVKELADIDPRARL